MSEANCVVDDGNSRLVYDRAAQELESLKKKDFSFTFNSGGDGTETATLQMCKDGQVLRYHTSKPYPEGSLKLKDIDTNDVSCIVKLKKKKAINLNEYFAS
ncbi:hypothetical protein EGW08_019809 [Elysia chlorotica]|uniref:Uncharacterized protein n=1 Tax=Elysia chlorotica TaxID=188477 RepID=A0A3S1H570_ELYCH|nr:hypothetical protein EGW08_019809 [Elysia chlorotica]